MSLLLDTNAYVAFHQGHKGVVDIVADAEQIVMSTIVLGELLFGFSNGSRYRENVGVLQSFLAEPDVTIMPVSLTTAEKYGAISTALRARGRPIPTNDIWIAAHAMESGAQLLSFDKHFEHLDNVEWIHPRPLID